MNLERVLAVRNSKTIYRDEDKCIKVFDENYSKSEVLNEALNHARVEETGLNVPHLIEVTTINGKWAIVYEFIKGKTLTQLMAEQPEKKQEYLELLVNLQMEIHSKTNPLLIKLRDKMNYMIEMCDLPATTRYDLHMRLERMHPHDNLCHGDIRPSNIIIGEDGKPYIIDWSHATKGNASADVARTYLTFCMGEDKELPEKYLDMFVEKSNTKKEYVHRWIPLVAAAQSVKGNEREKSILLAKAEEVYYE